MGVWDVNPIVIHMDSVKKYRNKSEWRPVNRAILTWTDPSGGYNNNGEDRGWVLDKSLA